MAPRKRGRGRPRTVEKEVAEQILKAITFGVHPRGACSMHGVGYSTWRRYGQERPDYWARVKRAKANQNAVIEAKILSAGAKSWQAMAWVLERRDPRRYGRPPQYLRVGNDGAPEEKGSEAEQFAARVRALVNAGRALSDGTGPSIGENGTGENGTGENGVGEGGEPS